MIDESNSNTSSNSFICTNESNVPYNITGPQIIITQAFVTLTLASQRRRDWYTARLRMMQRQPCSAVNSHGDLYLCSTSWGLGMSCTLRFNKVWLAEPAYFRSKVGRINTVTDRGWLVGERGAGAKLRYCCWSFHGVSRAGSLLTNTLVCKPGLI